MDMTELGRRHHLVARSQLRATGVGRGAIDHHLSPGGRWQRTLPGIYATHRGRIDLDDRRAAALLFAGPEALLTGPTVTALIGLRATPAVDQVHVVIPHARRRRSAEFVRIHRADPMPERRWIGGFPTVPVARAVVESCRTLDTVSAVRALVAEAVQRRRTTVEALAEELSRGAVRQSRLTRAVLAEVADGVRSPAEGVAYRLIGSSHLPRPVWNCDLLVGPVHLARPDAYWCDEAVALEIDSRRWHLGPAEWENTMRRHARMTSAGIAVVHVTPARVLDEPEGVVRDLEKTLAARVGVGRDLPIALRR